jgi:hypothetical protein
MRIFLNAIAKPFIPGLRRGKLRGASGASLEGRAVAMRQPARRLSHTVVFG